MKEDGFGGRESTIAGRQHREQDQENRRATEPTRSKNTSDDCDTIIPKIERWIETGPPGSKGQWAEPSVAAGAADGCPISQTGRQDF